MQLHAFECFATGTVEPMPEMSCKPQQQPEQIFPDVTPPAMAYVPYQLWSEHIYDAQTGLQQGTMFPVLDMPFAPTGGDCA